MVCECGEPRKSAAKVHGDAHFRCEIHTFSPPTSRFEGRTRPQRCPEIVRHRRVNGISIIILFFGHRSVRAWTREGVDGQERGALFGLGQEPDLQGVSCEGG
ncbi:hypothetical protein L210DRAFT_3557961, partial [Boletus edulis BED1]